MVATQITAAFQQLGELMITPEEAERVLGEKYKPADRQHLEDIPFKLKTLEHFTVGLGSDSAAILFPGFPICISELALKFPDLFDLSSLERLPPEEMTRVMSARWHFITTALINRSFPVINKHNYLPRLPEMVLLTIFFYKLFNINLWEREVVLCAPLKPNSVATWEGEAVNYISLGPFSDRLILGGDELLLGHQNNVGFPLSRRPGT